MNRPWLDRIHEHQASGDEHQSQQQAGFHGPSTARSVVRFPLESLALVLFVASDTVVASRRRGAVLLALEVPIDNVACDLRAASVLEGLNAAAHLAPQNHYPSSLVVVEDVAVDPRVCDLGFLALNDLDTPAYS